jgi:hypothetical protein
MQIRSVGIDLGKTTFHLVALGTSGKVLVKKKFTQKQLLAFTANMQTSLIGLEACAGAHFIGRALQKQGHDVRLIPAQFVKPFVKSNKNDFVDAEAIAEAVESNPFVSNIFPSPIKWSNVEVSIFVANASSTTGSVQVSGMVICYPSHVVQVVETVVAYYNATSNSFSHVFDCLTSGADTPLVGIATGGKAATAAPEP